MPPNEEVIEGYRLLLDKLLELVPKGGDIANKIRSFQKYHDDYESAGATMESSEFHLEGAISAFGLQYNSALEQRWRIEEIPEAKGFEPSHSLESLLRNYAKNFDRTSEAVRRTATNFLLNECLTSMKGNTLLSNSYGQTTGERSAPIPLQQIRVFGELSFSHKITPLDNSSSQSPYSDVTVNGRIDHGIGRTMFTIQADIASASTQLVVYLGSLHQSRLSRNWRDASVYGAASDGHLFTFIAITHHGVLEQSRQFDIARIPGDLVAVLGCLKYLLEKSAGIVLDGNTGHLSDVDDAEDPAIDLDDNPFTHPPDDDDY